MKYDLQNPSILQQMSFDRAMSLLESQGHRTTDLVIDRLTFAFSQGKIENEVTFVGPGHYRNSSVHQLFEFIEGRWLCAVEKLYLDDELKVHIIMGSAERIPESISDYVWPNTLLSNYHSEWYGVEGHLCEKGCEYAKGISMPEYACRKICKYEELPPLP